MGVWGGAGVGMGGLEWAGLEVGGALGRDFLEGWGFAGEGLEWVELRWWAGRGFVRDVRWGGGRVWKGAGLHGAGRSPLVGRGWQWEVL